MFSSPSSGVSLTQILLKLSKSFIFQSWFWWYSNQQLHGFWRGFHFETKQAKCASDYLNTSQVSHQTPLEKWMGLENWGGCKSPFFLGAFALIVSGKWNINRIQKRSNWLKSSHTTSFQPLCKTFKGKQINNWKTSCSEPQTKNPRPQKTQKIRMSDTHTHTHTGTGRIAPGSLAMDTTKRFQGLWLCCSLTPGWYGSLTSCWCLSPKTPPPL